MSNILLTLIMSWMVAITGYQTPAHLPKVQFEPHSFFVKKVCEGQECDAQGWYNDENIIYLDERCQAVLKENSYPKVPDQTHAECASLAGHEIVHYLQDLSEKYTVKNCENFLAREDESFQAQRIGMIPYLNFLIQKPVSFRPYKCE